MLIKFINYSVFLKNLNIIILMKIMILRINKNNKNNSDKFG